MSLISQNKATCTGDKAGDGEAIIFDANQGTFGFRIAKDVANLDPGSDRTTSVAVSTADGIPLITTRQISDIREIPLPSDYYVGHWIQVVNGTGMGQTRRITAYRVDAQSRRVTFDVSPPWDVPPRAGVSRISVGRQVWQAHIVDNEVDISECTKANQNGLRRSRARHYLGAYQDTSITASWPAVPVDSARKS